MLMGGCQSIHQPFFCLSVPRLSVAILTVRLFHQSTARLSVHPSVYSLLFFSTSTNCPSSFQPPATRLSPPTVHLSVCPSAYPLLFFQRLSITISTADCPSTIRHRFNHPLPVDPPTARLSLSVCLSSLVFPPTVSRRFDRRLCVYSPTVCHHF